MEECKGEEIGDWWSGLNSFLLSGGFVFEVFRIGLATCFEHLHFALVFCLCEGVMMNLCDDKIYNIHTSIP